MIRKFNLIFFVFILTQVVLTFSTFGQDASSKMNLLDETKTERDARMKWWREARFGMFIHWSMDVHKPGSL